MATVEDVWQHVDVGSFVAVHLVNYAKDAVLGEVLEKKDNEFVIHYWKGSWNKKWQPWLLRNKEPWTDVLPKQCVYLASFRLNESGKLQADTKRQMKAFLNAAQVSS